MPKTKKIGLNRNDSSRYLAAGEGFEPSHTESESAVLPLHNPAKRKSYYTKKTGVVKNFFPALRGCFLCAGGKGKRARKAARAGGGKGEKSRAGAEGGGEEDASPPAGDRRKEAGKKSPAGAERAEKAAGGEAELTRPRAGARCPRRSPSPARRRARRCRGTRRRRRPRA